jgi:Asp-tRNA(Asn)/Glu-tRNA(Gln) amidotransferase A subunit family amidase
MNDVVIPIQTIAAAEQLLGVSYTEAERAMMAETIAAQIDLARQRRAVQLPLALGPATRFDPRPPGFVMPSASGVRLAANGAPPLPDSDDEIAYASVFRLGQWIKGRQLSSVRLTRLYLDRITRIAPTLECIATLTPHLALQQAERADALLASGTYRGPLHGIPWGCKDIIDTAGIETAWGAEPYRGRVPETDATVVRLLAEAGAVMLGKLTVGALAYGDIWHGGRTRNPWNTEEGSSGSSAGSGSATAAGLVGFSLGTETLGSIVAPSLRCGVTGLRPTFGRVSRAGAMPLCWTLDKIGPMCRAVDDVALVLDALNAADPADRYQIPAPFAYDGAQTIAGLRVGYYEADLEASDVPDLERAAMETLRGAGVELVPLERPDLPYGALMSTLIAEAAASFEELTLSDRDDELTWQEPGAWPNTFRKARFLSAIDHVQLDRLRHRVMQEMDATLRQVNAIIGPPLAGPMLIITNYTGHPCLVLPVGFREVETRSPLSLARAQLDQGKVTAGPKHTVPHSVCLWGRLCEEGTILRLGRVLEAAHRIGGRRPPAG